MANQTNLTVTPAAAIEDDLTALEAQFGPFESIEPDRERYTEYFDTKFPTLAGLLKQARQAAPSAAA